MGEIPKTLDEIFAELIKKRAWYNGTDIDRSTASYDKKLFLQGKLTDERKRMYLNKLGYKIVQPELWI